MNATRAATTAAALGRRRRLARPRADADAGDPGQARARDPEPSSPSLLARRRARSSPRHEGNWFEPLRDAASRHRRAEEADDDRRRQCDGGGRRHEVERKEQRERAPLLYDLTSLQREANRASASRRRRTLAAAQALYEEHKAITYPRTNSRCLSGDLVAAAQADRRARSARIAEYAAAAALRASASSSCRSTRVVNDAKVDDHHAIIPTDARARRRAVLARRAAHLRHGRPALPGCLPPAGAATSARRSRRIVEERASSARAARSCSRPGWRGVYGRPRPTRPAEAGRGRRGRGDQTLPAARAGRGGRRAPTSRSRRKETQAAARATPRRRCSPRWRPPAS